MNKRRNVLYTKMLEDDVDGLIITKSTNIRYLSQFTGEQGTTALLITPHKDYLITDRRFEFQAKMETSNFEVITWREGLGIYGELHNLIKELSIKNPVVNMNEVSHMDYLTLVGEDGILVNHSPLYIENMRQIKEDDEIKLIRQACKISEEAFNSILTYIKPGITEIDIASQLEYEMRKRGGDGIAFPTIVATGPINGANCHATPSHRKIEQGDMITLDFGATYEGYCSDITRTVALGKPSDELCRIYSIVKKGKEDARSVLKEGVKLSEIDKAGRRYIGEQGYKIPHGIGHSFGYDIHEYPFITSRDDYVMQCNIVHTLEPGIYVPGLGGVRIEDDYLITKEGIEQLTNCSDELIVL